MPDEHEPARPALGSDAAATQEAIGAVAHLVEELQAGWDEHDAEVSNRHFADNVAWGSPFGATVDGYDQLHAIQTSHKRAAICPAPRRRRAVSYHVP